MPSGFVLWVMRDMPPRLSTDIPTHSRVVTLFTDRATTTQYPQWRTAVTSSQSKVHSQCNAMFLESPRHWNKTWTFWPLKIPQRGYLRVCPCKIVYLHSYSRIVWIFMYNPWKWVQQKFPILDSAHPSNSWRGFCIRKDILKRQFCETQAIHVRNLSFWWRIRTFKFAAMSVNSFSVSRLFL